MPNWCANKYVFYTNDENKGELLRLYNNLAAIMQESSEVKNGFEPGWLGKVAISHGIDWDTVPCRGAIENLGDYEPDDTCFTLETETAWVPTDELWEAVTAQYIGISYAYMAEEPGSEIYMNTDIEGRYLTEKYLIELCGDALIPEGWYANRHKPKSLDIREYFSSFDSLAEFCVGFTGKTFGNIEELQNYFYDIFGEKNNIIVGIHEFTAE